MEIGDCFASGRANFIDDCLGIRANFARPVGADTKIIDDDPGTACCQQSGMGPAEAGIAPGPGNDCHLTIKPKLLCAPFGIHDQA